MRSHAKYRSVYERIIDMTSKLKRIPKRKKGDSHLPQITARADDAFGSKNYAEFVTSKTKEGIYKTKRTLAVIGYVLFVVLYVVLCATVKMLLPFIALTPLFLWMLIYFTWWTVSVDYRYTVDAATLVAKSVYGDRYERTLFEGKIKDFSLVAPKNDEYLSAFDEFANDASVIDITSGSKAYDVYFALHTDEKGNKNIVVFEMTSQALGAIRYYNASATVVSKVKR